MNPVQTPAPHRGVPRTVLAAPRVWAPPMALLALLVTAATLVYLGSIIDPAGHLEDLPVAVVDQHGGETGRQLIGGLSPSPTGSRRLRFETTDLAGAHRRMDLGKAYVTVVIPPAGKPIQLLTNPRAGTIGVNLALGVLQPALAKAGSPVGATQAHRPLPPRSGLGLSAFYIALLTTFCGFLGGMIVHTGVDGVLGYATIEIGPRWDQRQPIAISRWHTLLVKWSLVVGLTFVLTGLMLLVASVAVNMDTPHVLTLWLLAWCSAAVIGVGTLTLLAALGAPGQIAALFIFVYLALASSGGTVPLEALGTFRFFAEFEPLRQIVAGTRSVLYFDAAGAAGLTRSFVGAGTGLLVWVLTGAFVTRFYDRKGLDRASPALLQHIDAAVRTYRAPR